MIGFFKRLFHVVPSLDMEPCLPTRSMLVYQNLAGDYSPYSPDHWRQCGYGMELADALYVVGRKLADELNARPGEPGRMYGPTGPAGISGPTGPIGTAGNTGPNIRGQDIKP